jgi:hypothetical protein
MGIRGAAARAGGMGEGGGAGEGEAAAERGREVGEGAIALLLLRLDRLHHLVFIVPIRLVSQAPTRDIL